MRYCCLFCGSLVRHAVPLLRAEEYGLINTDVAVPGLNRNLADSREVLLPSSAEVDELLGITTFSFRTSIARFVTANASRNVCAV